MNIPTLPGLGIVIDEKEVEKVAQRGHSWTSRPGAAMTVPSQNGDHPMTGFLVTIDAEHGGRWTQLRDPQGREWLWDRPNPARNHVQPGDDFVDVGGIEECCPTIGSNPDHGELWTHPWATIEASSERLIHEVAVNGFALRRELTTGQDKVTAAYRLQAAPGARFIWAAHALLELGVGAAIHAAAGPARAWPDHHTIIETEWPRPLGIDYGTIGFDDGSAMFCLLPGRAEVTVSDTGDDLRFRLSCADQPVSVGLWRNLGGYPWNAAERYRNIGIEPMLGNVFDLDAAVEDDAAIVPASGEVRWTLTIDNGSDGS